MKNEKKLPFHFNGFIGTGETMKKLAQNLAPKPEKFNMETHRHLLSGNPYGK